jgi:hypothetical protein
VARELEAMRRRFPALATCLGDAGLAVDAERALFFELIPHVWPSAAEAALRSGLKALDTVAARREIAMSDIREGIPYSSNVRLFPDLWEHALPAIRAHEAAYGGAVFTETWPSLSRGRAMRFYFEHHPPAGRILHVAPEAELERWFRARTTAYETLGIGAQNDLAADLTALPQADCHYDLVICRRVLEHVFDERSALAEIRRVLRPGGVLNVSVPESMHLPATLDWHYPDTTHHCHYRQYGADFIDRLTAAGFTVAVGDWLLGRDPEQLRAAGTYPFRFYNATRP